MKDKIQALLDLIIRDFPRGCDELRCEDCPLDTNGDTVIKDEVCDMLVKLHTNAE